MIHRPPARTHQLDISGSPTIIGQVVALNQADTEYPLPAPTNQVNPSNLLSLVGGFMVLSGTPNIIFNGNGLAGTSATFWRECRSGASVNPFNAADPCGLLWGGP